MRNYCGKHPYSMLLVCSSRSQQLRHNIAWGEGGLKGQAIGVERDHSDIIGGEKGECVNNFVTDCGSVSRHDESCTVLATQPGKIALSCLLGITSCVPQENDAYFFI